MDGFCDIVSVHISWTFGVWGVRENRRMYILVIAFVGQAECGWLPIL